MTQPSFRPVLLCGMPAVQSCFKMRPKAIKRLWHLPELAKPLTEICKWMAQEKLSYTSLDERELSRVIGHGAHNGVVITTERPPLSTPKPSDYEDWRAEGDPLLFLDDVADPVQAGTVARIAAATGIKRLLLSGASSETIFHERAWSTANGALDQLRIYDAGPLPSLLRALHERFCVVGFTRPGGRRVDEMKPIRVPGKPLAIIIGDTETGVARDVVGKCEHLLHIPGIGGNTLLNAGDTAAFGLPWLLRKERKAEGGFLAQKRARKEGKKQAESN